MIQFLVGGGVYGYHFEHPNRRAKESKEITITPQDKKILRISQDNKMKVRSKKAEERREEYFK